MRQGKGTCMADVRLLAFPRPYRRLDPFCEPTIRNRVVSAHDHISFSLPPRHGCCEVDFLSADDSA
jgi:hypothetical protein